MYRFVLWLVFQNVMVCSLFQMNHNVGYDLYFTVMPPTQNELRYEGTVTHESQNEMKMKQRAGMEVIWFIHWMSWTNGREDRTRRLCQKKWINETKHGLICFYVIKPNKTRKEEGLIVYSTKLQNNTTGASTAWLGAHIKGPLTYPTSAAT